MANIKSAKKRIDTIKRRRDENKFVKATLSTYVKNFRKALDEGRVSDAEAKLPEIIAYIDSACSKGVLHANTASRKVGRLSAALFKAKATVAPAKEEVKVEEVTETEVKAEEKPAKAKKATKAKEVATEETKEKKTTKKTTKAKAE
ncbi:MAG: 30S ribosomal protein S20 [Clostridia bacterium]|nr:30S ribosomal protein S20 [Clostridia bacterium]